MRKPDLICATMRGALIALTLFIGGATSAQSDETAPSAMGIAETVGLMKLLRFQPLALSPDGELVAYGAVGLPETPIVHTTDVLPSGAPALYATAELRLASTQSGAETLISSEGTNWNAAWSPDGTRLAFCSDRDGVAAFGSGSAQPGGCARFLTLPCITSASRRSGRRMAVEFLRVSDRTQSRTQTLRQAERTPVLIPVPPSLRSPLPRARLARPSAKRWRSRTSLPI